MTPLKGQLRRFVTRVRNPAAGRDLPMLALSAYTGLEVKQYEHETSRRTAEESAGYSVVEPGDIVFNPMWAYKGSVAVSRLPHTGTVSPAYYVLRPRAPVDGRFLAYVLGSVPWRQLYATVARGLTTYDRSVKWEDLATAELALPGDSEYQRAVADFLDRECDRVDELLGELEEFALAMREGFRAAASQAFDALPVAPLRFRLEEIQQGWSPECEARLADEFGWAVLKLGCVNGGRFDPLEHKRLPDELVPRPVLEVLPGDLLVSRANTRELVGSAAVVRDTAGRHLMLSDLLYRLRLVVGCLPAFVSYALASHEVRGQIEAWAAGSSGSMPKISQQTLRSLRVPHADTAVQLRIVEQLDAHQMRMRRVVEEIETVRGLVLSYREALIVEAVTGDLDVTRLCDVQMEERLEAARQGEAREALAG